jgi:hypothetical protein
MEIQNLAVKLLRLSQLETTTPATQTDGPRFGQPRDSASPGLRVLMNLTGK